MREREKLMVKVVVASVSMPTHSNTCVPPRGRGGAGNFYISDCF